MDVFSLFLSLSLSLSLFSLPSHMFSPWRSCPRVLKFWNGSKVTKILGPLPPFFSFSSSKVVLGFQNFGYDSWGVGGDDCRWLCRHVHRQISAHVHKGTSDTLKSVQTESKGLHRCEWKLIVIVYIYRKVNGLDTIWENSNVHLFNVHNNNNRNTQ